jgi:hypothetical protein
MSSVMQAATDQMQDISEAYDASWQFSFFKKK